MYIFIYIYIYMCVCVCMCVCVYTYIYIYIHMYLYMIIHIYICNCLLITNSSFVTRIIHRFAAVRSLLNPQCRITTVQTFEKGMSL